MVKLSSRSEVEPDLLATLADGSIQLAQQVGPRVDSIEALGLPHGARRIISCLQVEATC